MFFSRSKILLVTILIVGLFLRVWQLNISPPGFNADEAALGYNAYSLFKTGKDEWGQAFPITFKSFSDYKPGLYVYLAIPFVATLGLAELAVRLPSILLGALSILLIYLLSRQLFKDEVISIATAFLLAISPWHLHYSRGAWETNVATFFLLLGVFAFILGLEKRLWLYVSLVAFILSMYTYQSTRLVAPLLVFLLVVFNYKKIFGKNIIGLVILGTILISPLLFTAITDKGLARFQGISIFTDIGPINRTNEERGEHPNPHGFLAEAFHNKFTVYTLDFLGHYFDHFSPSFLFTSGDPLGRNKTPEMGEMYLFEAVTLMTGLYFLLTRKFSNANIVFLWLLVAPSAAALTYQTPHALRAHNMVIPLTLISGAGLGLLIKQISTHKKGIKFFLFALGAITISFCVGKYLHEYFVHLPKEYALEWEYGFSQLVPYVMSKESKYQKIVVTDRYDQPYILFLFYSKYDPALYQKTARPTSIDKFGFSTISSFDKFEFRSIKKGEIEKSKGVLFVGTGEEIGNIPALSTIDFPNGKTAFKIVGT